MNTKKAYYAMIGIVCLLSIASIVSVFFGDKVLKQKAADLNALKLENRVLEEQQVSLAQATKDVEKYKELKEIAQSIVPQDKDQAAAVREIVKIANESGVKLSAISFPASTLGQAAPATNSSGEGASSSAPKSPSVTQVKPVEGITGVYVMEINIQQDQNNPVTYDQLINFLSRLEQNRRTAQVTNVTVQPNANNRGLLTFSLVVEIFIKP